MTLPLARTPILAFAVIALSGSLALAQQTPAQPAPPPTPPAAPIERQPPSDQTGPSMDRQMGRGSMRPGMMQGRQNDSSNFRDRGSFRGEQGNPMASGFHIVPPGMWWKNPMVVQRLTLTPDQTKKMDGIFQQSRLQLIDLKANVEKQQVLLEPLLSANPLDSVKAMAQIDKVAQSRADLEKANARMLLGIRAVLTPDQWTKLRDHQGPGGSGPDAQGAAGPDGGRNRGMRGGGVPPGTANLVDPIDEP